MKPLFTEEYSSRDLYEIDCLSNGAPHELTVSAVVHFFQRLGDSPHFNIVRIQFVVQLFARMLKLRNQQYSMQNYISLLKHELSYAKAHAESVSDFSDMLTDFSASVKNISAAEATSDHFSAMFSQFSDKDFFVLSPANLKKLFAVNDFSPSVCINKHALDAGCGSGRYSYALHEIGFGKVTGLDFSSQNITFAQEKINAKGIAGCEFKTGNVVALPFESETFDFVFSNGVLHHVDAPYQRTLPEMYRVIKPGGGGYLSVMEKPGGILNDTIEICRWILKEVPEAMTLCIMQQMGFSGYRIYAVLDHVYAPINIRVPPAEIEGYLADAGFTNIRRFLRGLPSDDAERVYKQSSDSESLWKFGVGENRYTFKKNKDR